MVIDRSCLFSTQLRRYRMFKRFNKTVRPGAKTVLILSIDKCSEVEFLALLVSNKKVRACSN